MYYCLVKKKLILFILFFKCSLFFCQETNYWNNQYGANSTLLGGAVVSTYCDNGAMFYNPATMAFKDSGNISVSANLYNIENIVFTDALGTNLDIKNTNYYVAPQLVSGDVHRGKKIDVGFILLTKNDINFAFSEANKDIYQMRPTYSVYDTVHTYNYIASFQGHTRIYENWAGISLNFKLNKKWAVGVTNFVAYRFQKFNKSLNISAFGTDDTLYRYNAKFDASQSVTFDNLNNIIKVGVAYNSKFFDVGIAATLPSISLFGIGKASVNWYLSNSTPSVSQNYLEFSKEEKLKITYKNPFSISMGFCVKISKTKLFLSGEYFAPINRYALYNPGNVVTPKKTTKSVQFNSDDVKGVTKFANPVLNLAIGLEQQITKKIKLLGGFNTDFSSVRADSVRGSDNDISYSYINLWHTSLGVKINLSKKSLTVGLTTAYGSLKNQNQIANLTAPTDIEFSAMTGYPVDISNHTYKSIGFVLGLSF